MTRANLPPALHRLRVPVVEAPYFRDLPGPARGHFRRASERATGALAQALRDLVVTCDASALDREQEHMIAGLHHRLSALHRHQKPMRREASDNEARALRNCSPPGPLSEMSDEGFRRWILDLSRAVGGPSELRAHGVRSDYDHRGVCVQFPPAAEAHRGVRKINGFLNRSALAPSAFRATVALVLFGTYHPLADANGRTSRMLFNAVLQAGRPAAPYMPLYEIDHLSRGSLLLCVREVQYFGAWDPIAAFIDHLLALLID